MRKNLSRFNKIPTEVRDLEQFSEEQLDDIADLFENSNRVRRMIREAIYKKLNRSVRDAESSSAYESPNWALVQADNRGYRRALREVAKIVYKDVPRENKG